MAMVIKFSFEEIERVLREEVARKFNTEVAYVEWYADDEYTELTLGATMQPERGGPNDR